MKSKWTAILTFVLLLAPMSLFAASKNSETVTFPNAVTVGGTQIPAGTYKVDWGGNGTVTATINRGKKVLATVPATVTAAKSQYDGALEMSGNTLKGIEFKNQTIQFNQTNAVAVPTSGQ